jgi:subtilisin family serine protease
MKKLICYLSLIFIVLNFGYSQTVNSKYYYYNGEKRYLDINTEYVFVSTIGSDSIQESDFLKLLVNKLKKLDFSDKIRIQLNENKDFYWSEIRLDSNLTVSDYENKISKIKGYQNVQIVSPFFSSKYNKRIGLTNFFYVKLKTLADTLILKKYSKINNSIIIKQDDFMPLWFILSCTKNSTGDAIDLANRFYESGFFQFAEPDLMLERIIDVDDPDYPQQWGLKNTGQYGGTAGIDIRTENAWKITTGSSTNIAVLDDGIQLDHPDLQTNISSISWDSETSTSPSIVYENHATCVAGIAGAVGNTIGIKGVAPNCHLISISSTLNEYTPNIRQKLANGINWAFRHGADVINNSWSNNDLASNLINNAISNALDSGRNMKGTVIVFSTGNQNDSVAYPANSNPKILAVGAISECGQRKTPTSCDTETHWGSNFGSQLDVVAPGVLVPTTDRTGDDGYNPNFPIHIQSGGTLLTNDYADHNYTIWFNGTSAAAPHVSGLAALIISINPNLTVQQVNDIIEQTAQKIGRYRYKTKSGRNNGTWNVEVGYGLIDACAASLQAYKSRLLISGNYVLCTTSTPYSVSGVPTNATLSWNCSSNITKLSAPGSNPFYFQGNTTGPGWIEDTLTTDCGKIVLNRFNVWVGRFEGM